VASVSGSAPPLSPSRCRDVVGVTVHGLGADAPRAGRDGTPRPHSSSPPTRRPTADATAICALSQVAVQQRGRGRYTDGSASLQGAHGRA
jgi:hypothetical protein